MNISEDVQKNIETYREIWRQNKVITIPNFLNPPDAETLCNYLYDLKDTDWKVSIHPYQSNVYTFNNSP